MARKDNDKIIKRDRSKTPGKASRNIKGIDNESEKEAESGSDKGIQGTEELKGLGDVISKVTEAVGIVPCEGCLKRKDFLNVWFPFKQPRPLTDEEKAAISKMETTEYVKIYNDAFRTSIKDPGENVLKAIIKKLNKLAEY